MYKITCDFPLMENMRCMRLFRGFKSRAKSRESYVILYVNILYVIFVLELHMVCTWIICDFVHRRNSSRSRK